jgi:AbrB family looped-hinge helix DNA binding protein
MKALLTTVTSKGQVTIPVEIRRLLGVTPHTKVAFIVENGQVRIAPAGSVVKRTAGAIKGPKSAKSATKLREAAERAIAEGVVERG